VLVKLDDARLYRPPEEVVHDEEYLRTLSTKNH